MFKNIGSKIKGLATFLFWFLAIVSIIAGIIVIIAGLGNVNNDSQSGVIALISGIGIAVGGFIFAWLQNFLLYRFGELVDSNQKILEILKQSGNNQNN